MSAEMFYSDTAVIIYECIAILIMAFFIWKLSGEKKRSLSMDQELKKQEQDERLNRQLANERRGER
ncbi:MAG TPA: hypothetical protein DF613_09775 [Lachnospiraceae bacterium]|nr:hypothetical protein [Lachnospiraceae bacterium]